MVVDVLAIIRWLLIQLNHTLMKLLITLIKASSTILKTDSLRERLRILRAKTLGLIIRIMRGLSIHNFFRPEAHMIIRITFVLN